MAKPPPPPHSHYPRPSSRMLAAGAVVAVVAGAALLSRSTPRGNRDDAPGITARQSRFGDHAVSGRTVTISKPSRAELFAFWRDFENLPRFMDNLKSVETLGTDRSRWTIAGPLGDIVVESVIAQERKDELIAWKSTPGSDVETEGRVAFRDAPGGRGTQVELIVAYKPPMGRLGQAVAKLLQREPAIQARRDLRRFKSLMETGEIATSDNRLNMDGDA